MMKTFLKILAARLTGFLAWAVPISAFAHNDHLFDHVHMETMSSGNYLVAGLCVVCLIAVACLVAISKKK